MGCVAINSVTIWIRTANMVAYLCLGIIALAVAPFYFFYFKSPQYCFSLGHVSDYVYAISGISKMNNRFKGKVKMMQLVLGEEDDHELNQMLKKLVKSNIKVYMRTKTNENKKEKTSIIKEFICSKK